MKEMFARRAANGPLAANGFPPLFLCSRRGTVGGNSCITSSSSHVRFISAYLLNDLHAKPFSAF